MSETPPAEEKKKDNTVLYIAGAAVAGALIFLAWRSYSAAEEKKKKDDEDEKKKKKKKGDDSDSDEDSDDEPEKPAKKPIKPVKPIKPLDDEPVKPIKPMYPAGIREGQVVHCNGKTYKIAGGEKHHYPNPEVYKAFGSPTIEVVDCDLVDTITEGTQMHKLAEGMIVHCNGNIYKIEKGQKRLFDDYEVYQSWNSPKYIEFECDLAMKLADGPDMPLGYDSS